MRNVIIATMVVLAVFALATPTAVAAPPDIGGSCGYFHWHNADLEEGSVGGYHYHHCY